MSTMKIEGLKCYCLEILLRFASDVAYFEGNETHIDEYTYILYFIEQFQVIFDQRNISNDIRWKFKNY